MHTLPVLGFRNPTVPASSKKEVLFPIPRVRAVLSEGLHPSIRAQPLRITS